MKVKDYEKNLNCSIKEATLTLLLREDEVLLAMKKRGFGEGKWNGTGGKVNPEETVEAGAAREAKEEINITPLNLKKVGIISFYFPEKNFGQRVHIFSASKWTGKIAETEEMSPKWFKIKDIPYDEMWWDDKIWMPILFEGKKFKGSFMFDNNDKVTDYYLEEVSDLLVPHK